MTVIDMDLAEAAGIEAVEQIRRINPDASVLGLMTHEWHEATRKAAVRAGACGCLAKAGLNARTPANPQALRTSPARGLGSHNWTRGALNGSFALSKTAPSGGWPLGHWLRCKRNNSAH